MKRATTITGRQRILFARTGDRKTTSDFMLQNPSRYDYIILVAF